MPIRVLGICVALVVLGFASAIWFPQLVVWRAYTPKQPEVVLINDSPCDPGQDTCTALLGEMTLTLSLSGHVRTLAPFFVTVTLNGPQIDQVQHVAITFSMEGMYMGSNRFNLQQEDSTTWRGQAMLPICSNGRSDWQVAVEVGDNPTYVAEFSTIVEP